MLKKIGLLVGCLFAVGCSGSGYEGPALVKAKGQVLQQSNPLAGASLQFVPTGGTAGPGSYAVTDADGNFEVRTGNNQVGAPPGTYKVVISKLVLADGSPIPPDAPSIADLDTKDLVPPDHRDPDTTPVTVTIPEDGTESLKINVP